MTNITITSDLDAAAVSALRPLFETIAANDKDVTIDLSGASYLDPSGVGALAFLYKRLLSRGRRLVLVGLAAQPQLLLRKLRLTALLQTAPMSKVA